MTRLLTLAILLGYALWRRRTARERPDPAKVAPDILNCPCGCHSGRRHPLERCHACYRTVFPPTGSRGPTRSYHTGVDGTRPARESDYLPSTHPDVHRREGRL